LAEYQFQRWNYNTKKILDIRVRFWTSMCLRHVSLQRKLNKEGVSFSLIKICFRATDSSLRLFDIENGMMLIAPMEEMECDHLAR